MNASIKVILLDDEEGAILFSVSVVNWEPLSEADAAKEAMDPDLKVCDAHMLTSLMCFWTLSIVLFLFKTYNILEHGFCLFLQDNFHFSSSSCYICVI
jgi:hypothetical protein